MKKRTEEAERSPWARLTGALYLGYFVTAFATAFFESQGLEGIGKFGNVLGYALYAIVTLLFYGLFRPVNRRLSLAAALVSLAGCAIGLLTALQLPAHHVNALVFFGLYCLLLGYLILASTFLPHILGALLMAAGLGWVLFLIPAVASHAGTGIEALGVAAEGLLMLWLLLKGVNVQKWQKQARAAAKANR
jgi:Domain of unknown function (DUF4386)